MTELNQDLFGKDDVIYNHHLTLGLKAEFEAIANAKGNDKNPIIENLSEDAKRILVHTLDSFQKFGVSTIYKKVNGPGIPWPRVLKLLEKEQGRVLKAESDKMTQEQLDIVNGVFDKFKRWKLGIGAKTYLKVHPGSFKYFELQTANHLEGPKDFPGPGYGQFKLDGIRCIAIVRLDGEVVYLSRNGLPIYNVSEDVTIELKKYPGFAFDGEVRARKNFQASLSSFKKKSGGAEEMDFSIFDMVTIEELETRTCTLGYEDRRARLEAVGLPEDMILEHFFCETYEEAVTLYRDARAKGEEGLIFKKRDGTYNFKRTDDWLKMKPLESGDFKIIGYEEGSAGSKYEGMLGAWIVIDEDGIVNNIGMGITDEQRKKFWEDRDDMIGSIVEIEFMERTEVKIDAKGNRKGGKLRHGRFIKVRWDKDEINTKS
ncbi:ATP-dependent DNA ligase [Agrobacterium phage OLIVR5]|uniref:DNA ligase n=1 Tax=Agrobacterium phage OLIVR5 TaxID=2723773 RepID=A0A858MTI7_9CAUD|nr:ATP-dependent DNA ligase [Agrobacterium phage OLIVR5]QIW87721.1 ATP-dependent DNA ligase [Agrobacterium phage OLIVR5]QIW87983.1 ATP-dependent DNA ligase [Agrobacterium phage OLIVR6]